ncbi:MAG TPA: hypothetical protein VIX18_08625, partial [Nitrospirota bacterium]
PGKVRRQSRHIRIPDCGTSGSDVSSPGYPRRRGVPGAAKRALRVVLRSIKDGNRLRPRKPFRSFVNSLTGSSEQNPKSGKKKFLVEYAADFRKPPEYFISRSVTALAGGSCQGLTRQLEFKEKSTKSIVTQVPPEGEGK